MIERHITFNVNSDAADRFEAFFTDEYRPAMAESAGFVRADLLREVDQPLRYRMVLRFADGEAAAGWRTSEVHQSLQPALSALFSGNEIVGYEVIA